MKQTFKKSLHSKQESELIQVFTERKETAADYVFCCAILLLLSSFSEPDLATKTSELVENFCIQACKKSAVYVFLVVNFDRFQYRQLANNILLESKKKVHDMFSEVIGLLSIKR